jgi:hypothetical protein
MPALANQHYVWAHYLKAWAEDRFFCWRQSEKKLFPGQPKVVANERDFYKTCRLTDGDLQYLRTVVMASTRDETRRSNEEFVRLFQLTYTLRDVIAGSRMAPDKRLKIEDDLSEAERTMGENLSHPDRGRRHRLSGRTSSRILFVLRQRPRLLQVPLFPLQPIFSDSQNS